MDGSKRDFLPSRVSSESFSTIRRLPRPKSPSKCPLLCCFYAEFDIKEGPKLCYDRPRDFMRQDVAESVEGMEQLLSRSFCRTASSTDQSSSLEETTPIISSTTRKSSERNIPEFPVADSEDLSQRSIFTACGEYIIPSSGELTGNIISLSTHNIHVLTRPTMIANEKYERNSLLFSVGLILRRTEDPRPFQPVLSKLALTLQAMEVETEFLTSSKRDSIQDFLDGVLVSLNSDECNLLLDRSVYLSLKLFGPPRIAQIEVQNYDVPILLRRDWQQSSDWDLAIIWVSRHIDGISNAQQISTLAEVDMEMVRACLRVLKHHGVIALVDMFFYTNRYECTSVVPSSTLLQEAANIAYKHRVSPPPKRATSKASNDTSPELQGTSPFGSFTTQIRRSAARSSSDCTKDGGGLPGMRLSSFNEAGSVASNLKPEQVQIIKDAIAEFFCACHRETSVGELWMGLVTKRVVVDSRVRWKKIFRRIDHRRLTTFGIVHGLIRRIHSYPMLVGSTSRHNDTAETPLMLSPQQDTNNVAGLVSQLRRREERRQLLERAMLMMDGTHCDDDIVSSLDMSLKDVYELFPGRRIVELLAAS